MKSKSFGKVGEFPVVTVKTDHLGFSEEESISISPWKDGYFYLSRESATKICEYLGQALNYLKEDDEKK